MAHKLLSYATLYICKLFILTNNIVDCFDVKFYNIAFAFFNLILFILKRISTMLMMNKIPINTYVHVYNICA